MAGSSEQMVAQLAELMRQGQAETEARIAMSNKISAMSMNGQFAPKVNPLIEYFATDPVVCELEIDIAGVENTFCSATFKNPCMYVPCLWPHCILLGLPVSLALQYGGLASAARSHRLVLRQNSILYEVKSYPRRLRIQNYSTEACKSPLCCLPCMGDTKPIQEVFPLQEVSQLTVEECLATTCGSKIAPDTFVVRLQNIPLPLAAIDAPTQKSAAMFMAQANESMTRLKQAPCALPPAWNAYKARYQESPMAALGPMGGAMMMQQQRMMMNQQGMGGNPMMMNQQGMMGANAMMMNQQGMMGANAMMMNQQGMMGANAMVMNQQGMGANAMMMNQQGMMGANAMMMNQQGMGANAMMMNQQGWGANAQVQVVAAMPVDTPPDMEMEK